MSPDHVQTGTRRGAFGRFSTLTAFTVALLASHCASAPDTSREDTESTTEADGLQVMNSVSCVGLNALSYANHGNYCGPGNAYWTPDACHPYGGVQLFGPVADDSDSCCRIHDFGFWPPKIDDPQCDCGAVGLITPPYSQYAATCVGNQWTCAAMQPGTTAAQRTCQAACCALDAALSQCLLAANTATGFTGATRAQAPTLPPDHTGQTCTTDADCTYYPWKVSTTPYTLICGEGYCARSPRDPGQTGLGPLGTIPTTNVTTNACSGGAPCKATCSDAGSAWSVDAAAGASPETGAPGDASPATEAAAPPQVITDTNTVRGAAR